MTHNHLILKALSFVPVIWILIFSVYPSFASDSNPSKAIELLQKGNYSEAAAPLKEALTQDSKNPILLYNLSIAEFHNEHPELALAHIRKAIHIAPLYTSAHLLYYNYLDRLSGQFSSNQSNYEVFRTYVLNYLPYTLVLFLFIISLFFTGRSLINYFALKNQATLNELASPPFHLSTLAHCLIFVTVFTLGSFKLYDFLTPRATIIKTLDARSGPFEQASELFKLYAGHEVVINMKANNWTQITKLDGLTGWIPTSNLYQTSGLNHD